VVKIDPRPGGRGTTRVQRRIDATGFEARVALASLKGDRTVSRKRFDFG
jgi:hypothetical protein